MNRADKLCLLICRHYIREVEAVLGSGDFGDVTVRAYPPPCSAPHLAPDAVQEILQAANAEGYDTFLVSGCFFAARKLSMALTPECGINGVDQCFYLLAGKSLIDGYINAGAYMLSPGWLADWPAHIAQWGFDRTTARAFFGESISRLVMLDTGTDDRSSETLADFAAHISRPYQIVPVGLDYFRSLLSEIILKWRIQKMGQKWKTTTERVSRAIADQAMSFDLLAGLTRMKTEPDAIKQIMNLFAMLFAPGRMAYASVLKGRIEKNYTYPVASLEGFCLDDWLEKGREENTWIEEQKGFNLRIAYQDRTLGLLEVKEITFPEYKFEYLNLAILLARVCGLAIANGRLFQEVRQQAITDSLTSLYNRRHFFSLAKREISHAVRYDRPLAAIMLDIDYFKKVNDCYGHLVGDRVLTEIAQLCRREMRTADICGRYGGEEFIFLMPETEMVGARQMAERLCKSISELIIEVEGRTLSVTASLGVAMLDAGCSSIDALIGHSDKALYDAKSGGRNRVCVYENNMVD
jgi:diguanylate cyclase (GGDEF)-like protein